jgi:hypothetical protein
MDVPFSVIMGRGLIVINAAVNCRRILCLLGFLSVFAHNYACKNCDDSLAGAENQVGCCKPDDLHIDFVHKNKSWHTL